MVQVPNPALALFVVMLIYHCVSEDIVALSTQHADPLEDLKDVAQDVGLHWADGRAWGGSVCSFGECFGSMMHCGCVVVQLWG